MGTGKSVEEGEHGYREECGGGGTWVQGRVWRRGEMGTGKSVEEGGHGYREECGGVCRDMGTGKSVEEGGHGYREECGGGGTCKMGRRGQKGSKEEYYTSEEGCAPLVSKGIAFT